MTRIRFGGSAASAASQPLERDTPENGATLGFGGAPFKRLRRGAAAGFHPPMPETMRIGRYQLDPLRHTLSGADRVVQLSPIASRFLQALARQPGAVVERAVLIEELWRGDYLVGEPALNRVVSETRRAVGDSPREPALIQTVHRRGYRLVASPAPTERPLVQERWVKVWLLVLGTFAVLAVAAAVILGLAVLSRYVR